MEEIKLERFSIQVKTKYDVVIKKFPTQMEAAKFALKLQEQEEIKDEDIFISEYVLPGKIEDHENIQDKG